MTEQSQAKNSTVEILLTYKRIKSAYDQSGLKKKDFAEKANISKSYTTYLLSGDPKKGLPSDRVLQDIAEATGTTVQWLKTGEGKMFANHDQVPDRPGHPYGIDPRATKLLRKVITAVERYLDSENLELEPDKKAELITILYEDLLKDESKEAELEDTIARLAKLAA
jgi:transcriptional regulator with XRE-family HTH domain